MQISSCNFPAFAARTSTLIAEAMLNLLRSDASLAEFFTGGIEPIDLEDLRIEGAFNPPALGVAVTATQLKPFPAQQHELETVIELDLLTAPKSGRSQDQWLRQRIVDHIRALVLAQGGGQLEDPDTGRPLTEVLTVFQRQPGPFQLRNSNLLSTRIAMAFTSRVDPELNFIE